MDGDSAEALVVDDPDVPTEAPFVHWVVDGISPQTSAIDDGDPSFTWGRTPGLDGRALEAAIADSVVAESLLIASCARAD